MKKILMLVFALGLATILAACGDDTASDENKDKKSEQSAQPKMEDVKITDKEKVEKDKIVSKINGEEITGAEYNASYSQTKALMSQYGQDISDLENVKKQTLNVIVQQTLIKQAAAEQGIKIPDEEVQKQLETVKSGNAEQYASTLEQLNLTEQSFKEQLKFELTLEKYMEKEVKVEKVTDKEVQAYYDKLKEQSKEIPKLEEVKEQIKAQLKQQKQQKQLQEKIQTLQENAEIKHMI